MKYFLQQLPDMMYGISHKIEISMLKKGYHVKIFMPKSSSGDLSLDWNQYVSWTYNWKRLNHIMPVYCGLWKTILYERKIC